MCDCFSFNPADGCHINKLVLYCIVLYCNTNLVSAMYSSHGGNKISLVRLLFISLSSDHSFKLDDTPQQTVNHNAFIGKVGCKPDLQNSHMCLFWPYAASSWPLTSDLSISKYAQFIIVSNCTEVNLVEFPDAVCKMSCSQTFSNWSRADTHTHTHTHGQRYFFPHLKNSVSYTLTQTWSCT